ncbi:MAG: hypothetical protein ACE5DL_00505 [Nitrosopumilaceae archaeon]
MTTKKLTQKEDAASSRVYPCCSKPPVCVITYSVAGQTKKYSVCNNCISLDCFSKFIVEKTPIANNILNKTKSQIMKFGILLNILTGILSCEHS